MAEQKEAPSFRPILLQCFQQDHTKKDKKVRVPKKKQKNQPKERLSVKVSERAQRKKDGGKVRLGAIRPITVADYLLRRESNSSALLSHVNHADMRSMYPEGRILRIFADAVMDAADDLVELILPSMNIEDEEQMKKMREGYMKKLPFFMGKLEACLENNEKRGCDTGFFVGNRVTIADLKVGYTLSFVFKLPYLDAEKLMAACPKLTAWTQDTTVILNLEQKLESAKIVVRDDIWSL